MSAAPEVTVVVPTRDRWRLLSTHALPAALAQEGVDLELVIVDDGSTDGTSSGLSEWDDARIRVVRHKEAKGVATARNAGISVARGEWLAFLDDDDLWSPRKLRVQLDVARKAGADMVYAAAVLVDERRALLAADVFPDPGTLREALLKGNLVPGGCSNVLARAALVREVGCFDERLTYTEDWDLWVRLVQAGTVAACTDVLVAHVDHRGNALFRYQPDVLSEVEYVLVKHNPGLDSSAIQAHRLSALEWMAHEYVRGGYRTRAARAYMSLARERRRPKDVGRAVIALSGASGARAFRRLRRLATRRDPQGVERIPPITPAWLAPPAGSDNRPHGSR